jgi:hypothetical protein
MTKNVLTRWIELLSSTGGIERKRNVFYRYLNGLDNQAKFDYMYLTCPWHQAVEDSRLEALDEILKNIFY